jgi:hypothetical protein
VRNLQADRARGRDLARIVPRVEAELMRSDYAERQADRTALVLARSRARLARYLDRHAGSR